MNTNQRQLFYYPIGLFFLLLISQSIFGQNNTIATSPNPKKVKISQIQFSKDSSFINAFEINNQLYKLAAPIALFSSEMSHNKPLHQKILKVVA